VVRHALERRHAVCGHSPYVFCSDQGHYVDLKRGFAGACRRARITNFRQHDLRHTCASWLVMAGVPLPEVRDLLGHSSIKVTERYAHLAPENLRRAIDSL
jgi:integrase